MTPKEKAKELVHKMINIDSNSEMFDGFIMKEFYDQRAALKAVDEIIEALKIADNITFMYVIDYYKYVKQEIEKL